MVLQQDAPIRVWGSADAGETVTVRIAGQQKSAQADPAGHWEVALDKLASASGLTLVAEGRNTVTVQDVLVGEVWLCSGQSNMGMPLAGSEGAEEEIAAADYPQMRFFTTAARVRTGAANRSRGQVGRLLAADRPVFLRRRLLFRSAISTKTCTFPSG